MPPFCGNITGNCVNVWPQEESQDTVLAASVCASECGHPIDLRAAPDGFYFLEVQERAQRYWFKLVVQQ
jgi:hypothetical protein